ncbi:MAG: hypothetical protein ACRC68_09400, partial [Clostridium sp.]
MKIRIDDERADLENDFNIVVNEHTQNDEELKYESGFENYNKEDIENNSMFNVEIQYSEEGSYADSFVEKHKDYDEFYKSEGLNTNNTVGFENSEQYYTKLQNSENESVESFSKVAECDERFDSLANEASENYINDYKAPYEDFSNECNNYKSDYDHILETEFNNNCIEKKGEIVASVRLDNKNGVEIKSAKVNLYSLNGVCPKLHDSKLTDCNGEVAFTCLENGCYRVISIVDRRYFEKPIYTSWNEVTIDTCIKYANV